MKHEIPDILKKCAPEYEETVTIVKSLRGRLANKLDRV